jgi:Ino eighty subunit 2
MKKKRYVSYKLSPRRLSLPAVLTLYQMDTINRLLRKQAPKRRGRIPAAEAAENAAADQEIAAEVEPADPIMVRWISGREGSLIAVPEEWVGTPAGSIFGGTPRKLVEEV